MFIFGHIGISVVLLYLINKKFNFPVDYRYVILGSMLSDIIDKPLGNILLYGIVNNGRIFGHTLLFALLLTIIGVYRKKVLQIAYGVWTHLILDRIWLNPVTLMWPLLGNFMKADFEFWHFTVTIREPYNIIGEVAGISILLLLMIRHKLYIGQKLRAFLKNGRL